MILAGISILETVLLIAIGVVCLTIMGSITYKTFKKKGKPQPPEDEKKEE